MKNNNNNIIIVVFHGRYYVRALLVLGTIIITITADITVYFNILFSLCLSYSFCLYAFGMDDTKTAKNKEEKIKHRAIISKEPVYLHVQYSRVRLVLYFFFYISAPRHIDPKISTEVASSTFIKLMMSKTHRQTHNRLATHMRAMETHMCVLTKDISKELNHWFRQIPYFSTAQYRIGWHRRAHTRPRRIRSKFNAPLTDRRSLYMDRCCDAAVKVDSLCCWSLHMVQRHALDYHKITTNKSKIDAQASNKLHHIHEQNQMHF